MFTLLVLCPLEPVPFLFALLQVLLLLVLAVQIALLVPDCPLMAVVKAPPVCLTC